MHSQDLWVFIGKLSVVGYAILLISSILGSLGVIP